MGYEIVVGVGGHTGFHSDGICSELWFGNIPEMVGESCVPLQMEYRVLSVMIFPFFSFYFTFQSSFHSIPFGPHSLSFPTSLLHKALLVSLIYDSQALRLTSPSISALPCTALWLVLTPFHLEAAPPLYFPSIWLVMTQPLSFTGLPFALPSMYKYLVG